MKASHFQHVAPENLRVLPPLEPKDKSVTWVRGSIRDKDFNELIITGPRLPVLFSGCRYNNVVFSIRGPGYDEDFEGFLHSVLSRVEETVCGAPDKFKPGLKNAALLQFDRDFIRPSSYAADLPNEMRVKLAIKREQVDNLEQMVEIIETMFVDERGQEVNPQDIEAGSEIIPIIRIGYYRNANKFGLNMTLLKGMVFPGTARTKKTMDYSELEFDM